MDLIRKYGKPIFCFGHNNYSSKVLPSEIFIPKLLQVVSMLRIITIEHKHLHYSRKVAVNIDGGYRIAWIGLHEYMKTIGGPLKRIATLDHSFHCPTLRVNKHRHFGTSVLYGEYLVDSEVIPIKVL